MLKESYLANVKNLPKNSIKIVVTRSAGHMLSPSWTLLNDYKSGKIDWDGYVKTFYREMDNPACMAIMREIKKMARTRDLYLICYEAPGKNCHRHLLIDIINKMDD
jgi:uncharacterized protein YeaO (DUF488 family)